MKLEDEVKTLKEEATTNTIANSNLEVDIEEFQIDVPFSIVQWLEKEKEHMHFPYLDLVLREFGLFKIKLDGKLVEVMEEEDKEKDKEE